MIQMRYQQRGLLAAFSLLAAHAAHAQDSGEWLVAPYVWLPSITLDRSVSDGGDGGISGDNLLDKIDAAGMARVEYRRGRWGVSVDYIFLSMTDSASLSIPPNGLTAQLRGDMDLDVWEVSGIYRPSADIAGLDVLFGFRSIGVDTVLLLAADGEPVRRIDREDSVTDLLLGARYVHEFGGSWHGTIRGDYSFGDSEGTVNLMGTVGYRFTELFALNLGYRYTALDYEKPVDGEVETTEIDLSGPILGFVFRF